MGCGAWAAGCPWCGWVWLMFPGYWVSHRLWWRWVGGGGGGAGQQLWLSGLEPGIVVSVQTLCRLLVGPTAVAMGVALGGWRLGSGCEYQGLA